VVVVYRFDIIIIISNLCLGGFTYFGGGFDDEINFGFKTFLFFVSSAKKCLAITPNQIPDMKTITKHSFSFSFLFFVFCFLVLSQ
jgi:hypothetical protein